MLVRLNEEWRRNGKRGGGAEENSEGEEMGI